MFDAAVTLRSPRAPPRAQSRRYPWLNCLRATSLTIEGDWLAIVVAQVTRLALLLAATTALSGLLAGHA